MQKILTFCNSDCRFKVVILVVVGAEADDIEDGGGDEDVGRYSKQLSAKDETNLDCFNTMPLLLNLCHTVERNNLSFVVNLYTLMHDLVLLQLTWTKVPREKVIVPKGWKPTQDSMSRSEGTGSPEVSWRGSNDTPVGQTGTSASGSRKGTPCCKTFDKAHFQPSNILHLVIIIGFSEPSKYWILSFSSGPLSSNVPRFSTLHGAQLSSFS